MKIKSIIKGGNKKKITNVKKKNVEASRFILGIGTILRIC